MTTRTAEQKQRHAAAQRRYMARKRFSADLDLGDPIEVMTAKWLAGLALFGVLLAVSNGWWTA